MTILSAGPDPARAAAFSYLFDAGVVYYSSIPLDYYLAGGGPPDVQAAMVGVYAPNVLAYVNALSAAPPCPWDLDGDGTVGVSDLLILVMSFGPCGDDCDADFNEDGLVNAADLLILLGNFGPCPGSPCIWDVNGDGVVDRYDLRQVVGSFGPCEGCPEDVNGDGFVNGLDAAAVTAHFGPCP